MINNQDTLHQPRRIYKINNHDPVQKKTQKEKLKNHRSKEKKVVWLQHKMMLIKKFYTFNMCKLISLCICTGIGTRIYKYISAFNITQDLKTKQCVFRPSWKYCNHIQDRLQLNIKLTFHPWMTQQHSFILLSFFWYIQSWLSFSEINITQLQPRISCRVIIHGNYMYGT